MRYAVRALRQGRELVSLDIEAGDEADAAAQTRRHGLVPLSVAGERTLGRLRRAGTKTFDVVLFSQELLALLQAGINIVEAIETLLEKEHRDDSRQVLDRINRMLGEGKPLSVALASQPEHFSPLYVATVRASERTSDLDQGLTRYVAYAKQINDVRARLISASIYPALLIGAGGLVVLFLLGYVVPRFAKIYGDLGERLPAMSRLLLYWGQLVEQWGPLLLLGAVLAGIGLWRALASPIFRQQLIDRVWSLPAIGLRLRLYELTRFYRTLGMLLRGGIPVATAIDMVVDLLRPGYRENLIAAVAQIREGLPISSALSANNLTTPVAVRMLRVGERGGQMGEMMERIAGFYDEELERWVERFTRIFEPVLMAVIGLVIGIVVVLMYLPIFELAGNLR